MGHAGASRKSPNDAPWETLSLRLSRPISAPLRTPVRAPAGYLHHSWQGTCGVPAPLLTGHLRGTCTTPDSCSVMETRRRRSSTQPQPTVLTQLFLLFNSSTWSSYYPMTDLLTQGRWWDLGLMWGAHTYTGRELWPRFKPTFSWL